MQTLEWGAGSVILCIKNGDDAGDDDDGDIIMSELLILLSG